MTSFHELEANTIDGHAKSLGDFKGNAVLIVNVASECGFTPQYKTLEALHRKYSPRGFRVLGFPCNQFGGQEPGTEAEIKAFCASRYDVTFPMFAKVDVNGPNRSPVFAWLTVQKTEPEGQGDIGWNFAKFLVDKQGKVRARFSPNAKPDSEELVSAIEQALSE